MILSRPMMCGFVGCTYVLYCAYLISLVYSRAFAAIGYAIDTRDILQVRRIKRSALTKINSDALFLVFYLIILTTTFVWFTLAFYGFLNKGIFSFFYVFDDYWYHEDSGKFWRFIALWTMASASAAILCAALWFQYWHWRMFQKLLSLRMTSSPILIYHGFSKLWLITNIASLTLLSGNLILFYLVDFKPDRVQLILAFLITFPGTLGLLYPTSRLYLILWAKKDGRVREILSAADRHFRAKSPIERILGYSGVYSDIAAEKGVGGMQAVVSFLIGIVSFFVALGQLVGLDYYTRVFASGP